MGPPATAADATSCLDAVSFCGVVDGGGETKLCFATTAAGGGTKLCFAEVDTEVPDALLFARIGEAILVRAGIGMGM